MNSKSENFSWLNLIIGIILIISSFIVYRNPAATLTSIAMIVGIMAILSGIGEIILRNKIKKYRGDASSLRIVSGVIQILVGIFILFNLGGAIISLPFVFAFWFLFSSIVGIIGVWPIRKISTGAFTLILILNIIGIFIGLFMINNPLSAMFTLVMLAGFYLLIAGIREIISAF